MGSVTPRHLPLRVPIVGYPSRPMLSILTQLVIGRENVYYRI